MSVFLSVFVFAGCSPCGPWSEIPIDANTSAEPALSATLVRDGMEQLAAWTERESTCVSEVRFVDDLRDGSQKLNGRYLENPGRVFVESTLVSSKIPSITIHEFCHAIDFEGQIVDKESTALESVAEGLPAYYASETDQLHEAFARVCTQGPQGVAVLHGISQICDLDLELDAHRFVEEQIFPIDDSPPIDRVSAVTESSDSDLREGAFLAGAVSPVAAWEDLFVVDWSVTDGGWIEPMALLLDPNGDVLAAGEMDAFEQGRDSNGNPSITSGSVIGSDSGPLFLHRETQRAFRFERAATALSLTEVELPVLPDEPWGFELNGDYFVAGYLDRALVVELIQDGRSTPLTHTSPHGDASTLSAFHADGQGALIAWETGTGLALQELSWEGELLWEAELTIPGARVSSVVRNPSGGVMFDLQLSTVNASVAILVQQETQSWSVLETDGCTTIGSAWVPVQGQLAKATWEAREGGRAIVLGQLKVE